MTKDDWEELLNRVANIEVLVYEDYPITNAKKDIMKYELEEIRATIEHEMSFFE